MLKYILSLSLSLLTAVSATVQAESIIPNNFTMSELENIEYTATLSYIPKEKGDFIVELNARAISKHNK